MITNILPNKNDCYRLPIIIHNYELLIEINYFISLFQIREVVVIRIDKTDLLIEDLLYIMLVIIQISQNHYYDKVPNPLFP